MIVEGECPNPPDGENRARPDQSSSPDVRALIEEFREKAFPGRTQEVMPLSLSGDDASQLLLPGAMKGNTSLTLQKVTPHEPALTPERKAELKRLGLIGVSHLRESMARPPVVSEGVAVGQTRAATAGIEREQSAVFQDTFEPAFAVGKSIRDQARASEKSWLSKCVSPELGRHQIEQNTPVFTMKSGSLRQMDGYLRRYDTALNEIAVAQGAYVLSTGLLPSLNEENLKQENLNPGERYNQLVAALADALNRDEPFFSRVVPSRSGDMTTRFYADEHGQAHLILNSPEGSLHVENVSVLLESVMTSMQVHIDVPNQSEYVGYHRACDLLTPALIAVTAASPLLAGFKTGFMESRNGFLWQVAVSPWRTGYLRRDWINDPLEQFYDAQVFGPLLEPSIGGKGIHAAADESINIALENAKTIWPFNRTTLSFAKDEVRARIENRVMSAGPTVTDEMAHFTLAYGGTIGLHKILKEAGIAIDAPYAQMLDRSLHFMHSRNNFFRACADGLEADFRWIRGSRMSAGQFVSKVAVPAAIEGMRSLGIGHDEAMHYIKPVLERAQFSWRHVPYLPRGWKDKIGLTPADVILYLDEVLPKFEAGTRDRLDRGQRITELMVEANEYDRRIYDLTGQGPGILGWFRDHYLPALSN